MEKTEIVWSHYSEIRFRTATAGDILSDAVKNYQINGDDNQAAAIAFYAILSAIPFFILTLWIAGLIFGSNPDLQVRIIRTIQEFSPFFSQDLLKQLGHIEQKKRILGSIGIITLLWSSALIFNTIETSFGIIFRQRQGRNYIVSKAMAIAMIPMGWSVGMISVGATYIAGLVNKNPLIAPLLAEGRWLPQVVVHGFFFGYAVPFLVLAVFFTAVYKVIPTGRISWGSALTGGILFSVLMDVAKHTFTWYVSNYTHYDVIYGSLQASVILVIWVFYIALILLFCAEIMSSCQRRSLILLEKAFVRPEGRAKLNERLFRRFGRFYKKGAYVFEEGDTENEIFYILIGRVAVEKKAGAISKVLTELGPGQYFWGDGRPDQRAPDCHHPGNGRQPDRCDRCQYFPSSDAAK